MAETVFVLMMFLSDGKFHNLASYEKLDQCEAVIQSLAGTAWQANHPRFGCTAISVMRK